MKKGGKAESLERLVKTGFNVPLFFVCDQNWSEIEVLEKIDSFFGDVKYFAVRSSAVSEDSKEKSFAGHFYSGIGIARNDVFKEFKKVIASFGNIKGSVIVQRFIDSDYSGVMFTRIMEDKIIVNSTFGLCSTVVSGGECDEYVFEQSGSLVRKKISINKHSIFFENGEMNVRNTNEESLDEEKIQALICAGKKIELFFGASQDIEWCCKDGELYILQSRPITKNVDVAEDIYFDSANIAESYSGIVLPLTISFAKMVYSQVYKDLLRMSGVSKIKLVENSEIFNNLLGFFYGRMYYNMNNWYKMAQFIPGYERNKHNFELMITSNIKNNLRESIKPSILFRITYPIILLFKIILLPMTFFLFRRGVERRLRDIRKIDFSRLNYSECLRLFENFNKGMLRRWYITVENDFFVMTYLGVLKRLIGEDGLQDILVFKSKATEQVSAIYSLSRLMESDVEMWKAIQSSNIANFNSLLVNRPKLNEALQNYLCRFGGRFANELKLESIGVDEDVTKLFSVLKGYNTYKPQNVNYKVAPKTSFAKSILLMIILRKFKKYSSRREDFRLLRSNTFGMSRRLFRRLGEILTEENVLEKVDDIFYLDLNEVLSVSATSNHLLRDTVEKRKKEYLDFSTVSPPAHFVSVNGCPPSSFDVQQNNNFKNARPVSSGVVRGRAKVFKDFWMPDKIDFEILVTSHTDPGWTALIALSKGIIIEHGGVLSHASIVARELGIPAVIGAENATDIIKDGDMVEIDGSTGRITIM